MSCSQSLAIAFVCQAGPLENKALLLAASLKHHLRCNYELIAAVPTPAETWQTPDSGKMALLERMGARIVPIINEIESSYPIGNKVSCLRIATDAQRLVFVDTDILCVGDLGDERRFALPFSAKPVDLPRVLGAWQWRRAYAAAGLKPPVARVATTLYGQLVLPYFNAGVIAVDPRSGLGDAWLDCCRRIDRKWGIGLKRPHLDQIALPVAVEKLRLKYECLGQQYNFPVHLKPIDPADPPLLAHYHSARVLRREPLLAEQVLSLCEEIPTLADVLKQDPEFSPLFESRPRRLSFANATSAEAKAVRPSLTQAPELIVTGIPRSGTSYLCNLLHRFDNCVVLNEPDEISRPLRKETIPYGVGTFYRDVRRDILEGKPIRNKLLGGKVTDETLLANELTEYSPSVATADFVLGVKCPLGFLFRLQDLRRAMPHARIVACVRNPFDTIASWKTSFSHLKSADVTRLPVGGLSSSLSAGQRSSLRDLARIKHEAWRRAAWWRLMAELLLDARAPVRLIRYHLLTADPASTVQDVLEDLKPGNLREPMEPSETRIGKRSVLDDDDLQAIHALCGEHADALGVGNLNQPAGNSDRGGSSACAAGAVHQGSAGHQASQQSELAGFTS